MAFKKGRVKNWKFLFRRIVAPIIVWLSIQVRVPRFDLASKESLKISSKTYFWGHDLG